MFDTSSRLFILPRPANRRHDPRDDPRDEPRDDPRDDPKDDPDMLKRLCREPADLWALKRRARRPFLPPQRLPQAARTG